MANGIRTGDTRGFNKGRSLKFRVGSRVRQRHEEGQRIYLYILYLFYIYKNENNSSKTLNDKNYHASSQKFRQLLPLVFIENKTLCKRNWHYFQR